MSWRKSVYGLLAAEISRITRYCDDLVCVRAIAVSETPSEGKDPSESILVNLIDARQKAFVTSLQDFPDWSKKAEHRGALLINGNFNYCFDIQAELMTALPRLSRHSRVIAVLYSSYMQWFYNLASRFRIRKARAPTSFFTRVDITNLARISGYEVVRERSCIFLPWELLGVGTWINRVLAATPIIRWFSLAEVVVLRPVIHSKERPSLSIVIPARNEKGNIASAIERLPDLGCEIEMIFVEGHSSDGTWEEIERVVKAHIGRVRIKAFQQTGKGKADAVRLGFSQASGEVLTILDADLTMPPELLGRFYEAYVQGHADFVNGSRLVYPMEGEAMRFLNKLGNVFFAKALSSVLEQRLGDSLCGTKLLSRRDYARIVEWRKDFGDFDPFGDFELLFPAAILGLGVVDVPVRYRARTYGTTNIRRFRDGLTLLRMTLVGLFRIRVGSSPKR
ncbi:MAG TPA: glycosyl transferase [Bdellovibrionales bacterium]|nr:MAG: hypothetical protein A2Z97_05595 [Bdellovibrionales bacterium GWB1_52_6]OFZ04350.1 MAG: hypothetical protein A2X97_06810 [Bdellovibrionales bacterium GWA1_52_35]OFZ40358.1 MAG: hypothetical protein A2070_15155 [Bdellovibrionales bacterium GWC1_52_8]HAR41312.1 glycosyl transferase [Bdellovibrionales bacterium]HCM40797.1 glycosyl transferase [Bdellovibrionales bacterium]